MTTKLKAVNEEGYLTEIGKLGAEREKEHRLFISLNMIKKNIRACKSVDRIDESIVKIFEEVCKGSLSSIFEVVGDEARLLYRTKEHLPIFIDIVKVIKKPLGVTWIAITTQNLQWSNDASNDNKMSQAGKDAGVKAYISIPIYSMLRREIIRVVNLKLLGQGECANLEFSPEDIELVYQIKTELEGNYDLVMLLNAVYGKQELEVAINGKSTEGR